MMLAKQSSPSSSLYLKSENDNESNKLILKEFIKNSRAKLNNWMNKLNLLPPPLPRDNEKKETMRCPFNAGHDRILVKNFERHASRCQLKTNRSVIERRVS